MSFKGSEAFLDFIIDLFICLLLFVNYGNSTCYYRFSSRFISFVVVDSLVLDLF